MSTEADQFTFVTVTCGQEYDLLRLQARSLALYLPDQLVYEIVVIDNSIPSWLTSFGENMRNEYQHLWRKVRYVDAADIAVIPETAEGWRSQQIIKLMISGHVKTSRYVVLDTKNHLVFPVSRDWFEIKYKLRSWLYDYSTDIMRPYCERSLSYFDLNPQDHLRAFMPTTTPFVLPTTAVRDLTEVVVQREQCPFPIAFLNRGLSEFLLFASFITACGNRDEYYDFSGTLCPTIWESDLRYGDVFVKAKIAHGEHFRLPFFAVHRRALPRLNREAVWSIAEFWQRRRLFETTAEAAEFIACCRVAARKGSTVPPPGDWKRLQRYDDTSR